MTAKMTAIASPNTANTDFTTGLRNELHTWLQPTLQQQQAAVLSVKSLLDPLARDVVEAQTTRRHENRKKRKRGSEEDDVAVLQLRQIYTDGFPIKQVWEQARRVLDAAYEEIERELISHLTSSEQQLPTPDGTEPSEEDDVEMDNGEDIDLWDELDFDGTSDPSIGGDELPTNRDEEEIENIAEDLDSDDVQSEEDKPQATYKEDPNKLNDGFFSIDDFNKQSQFLEQMDARGEDDNPSDEDEIDWDADPMAQSLPTSRIEARGLDEASDEDGPTFGNADLYADDSDDEEDVDDIEGGELDGMMPGSVDTSNIRYAEFFEPPPRKPSKLKRTRALPKTQPPKVQAEGGDDGDAEAANLERAMADVRRDLLESDEELSDADEGSNLSDDSDALPRLSAAKLNSKSLSTHEKQQLQIAEEIRRLEAINVSKKPWTLSGEASAGARPLNSLIEEDLDFERTGKPVPVITVEVTNDIEALIKRRILAREFDEVTRRAPTALDSAGGARRGRADVVVDDTKPTTGLGEMYESEFQRNTDPTSYIDKNSTATKKQHEEIDKLWREVRDQLDVLGNLHFKPKRAEIEIKTVEDKPRITMEDARPAVSGGIDESGTMLAPQEIYRPGTDSRAERGEILNRKSGGTRAAEEMTREEKLRRRRREKERQKKANTNTNTNGKAGASATQPPAQPGKKIKKAEQEGILKDLQSGGVKLIGKGGELQDLSTKKKRGRPDDKAVSSASGSALKL